MSVSFGALISRVIYSCISGEVVNIVRAGHERVKEM